MIGGVGRKSGENETTNKNPMKNRLFFAHDANRNDGDDHFFRGTTARSSGSSALRRRNDDAGSGYLRSGFSHRWGSTGGSFGSRVGATCCSLGSEPTAQRSDDSPGRDRHGGWHPTWSDGRVRRREKQNFAHRNWREKRSALKGAGEGGLSGLSTESEADRKSSSASGDVGEWFHI